MSDQRFDTNDLFGNAERITRKQAAKKTAGLTCRWTNATAQEDPAAHQEVKQTLAALQSDPSQFYAIKWHGYAGDEGTYDAVGLAHEPKSVAELADALGEDPLEVVRQAEDGYFSWATKKGLLDFTNLSLTNPEETYGARQEPYFFDPQSLPDFDQLYERAMEDDGEYEGGEEYDEEEGEEEE